MDLIEIKGKINTAICYARVARICSYSSMDRMIGYGSNRPGDDCPERTEAERRTD